MNPRLVIQLFASATVGALASGAAMVAGWGPLAALLVYSAGGSLSLLALSLIALREWPRPLRARHGAARA